MRTVVVLVTVLLGVQAFSHLQEVTMRTVVVLTAVLLGVQAFSHLDVQEQWNAFKQKYGRQYSSETEETFRMKIFMDNLYKIERHNHRFERGLVQYTLGMNHFGDLLHHEIVGSYRGFNTSRSLQKGVAFVVPNDVQVPDSVDWRTKGAVTPVKNQLGCGSGYCFSAAGSLEGQHFLQTGILANLSAQNLLDCSKKYGNSGCDAGTIAACFTYIRANGGIDTEESYPYEDDDRGECRYKPRDSGATVTGFVDIETGSEQQLQVAVATVGPISVAIDSSFIFFYHGGVVNEPLCKNIVRDLDHAVLVVGYGFTNELLSKDYWIVKNSWGEDWGIQGYALMSRNKDNQCGIATLASYPLVK